MKTTSSGTPPVPRPEDENLGVGANMAYGLQHVLTMYGGIVAVPLILGQAAGLAPGDIGLLIAASLFAGGLAEDQGDRDDTAIHGQHMLQAVGHVGADTEVLVFRPWNGWGSGGRRFHG
ncbi:solute carrier family 23 protein, partial [Pseudomonas aeruginosa]|uniref:solute carrier family 23 protein n=2 Tax=Pseudomonas aeruginosa TaxID=287 RepID=UPI003D768888